MATMGNRLRQARAKAGYDSARAAAIAHGWGVSTYTAHENGQNEFGPDNAKEYAKAFKTTEEWLLLGKTTVDLGIDAQLKELPQGEARRLIDVFNTMIENVRLAQRLK